MGGGGSSRGRAATTSAANPASCGSLWAITLAAIPLKTVPTKTATMMPLMARNPAAGFSSSRRAASNDGARRPTRAIPRATSAVSHGPDSTMPTIITRKAAPMA